MNLADRLLDILSAHNRSLTLCAALLFHGLLLAWISTVNAPMYDEIAHVPSGLAHWRFGSYDLYRVNPPLMRMIATIPLLVIKPNIDWNYNATSPYSRPEFSIGTRFMEINGSNTFWYFTVCRWAQIPVSILGGWVCYRWAGELFGKSSGYVALLLWCFCPNVLAWGSTITPDLGASVFGVLAAYTFWRWLKSPTWSTTFVAGACLGLAELSKSTWIVLFALWPFIWVGWQYCIRCLAVSKPPALQLAAICLTGVYLLNLGYGFEGSFQRLGQFRFISHALGGKDAHESPGNRFHGTWVGEIPVPVPSNYLRGIDVQRYDFEKGKWSYLRGEQKVGGWKHYYLYALAVKTPLGTLFLLGLASFLMGVRRDYVLNIRHEMVLLLPAIVVLFLVSSQTGFNRYLRYVLPAVPFLYIFASRTGKAFELKQQFPKVLCGIGVGAAVLGSLSVFPHSMSYFNQAAGGPRGGPKHLLDANIDWGQDLLELKRYIDRHPEVNPIRLAYFGYADPQLAGFPYKLISKRRGEDDLLIRETGWYAISVNHVFGYRHYENDCPEFTCFQQFSPDAMAGYSIYIYHITDDKLSEVCESQRDVDR